ncbi:hypothetical protein BS049_RS23365 [Vibrio parahaemolyticus]|nr:hypothetical protein [Vibrio parahaemolyticus]
MASQSYYELMQCLAAQQKRQAMWRRKMVQGLETVRSLLEQSLGVVHLRYHNGVLEYQIEQYRAHWTDKPEVIVRNVMKTLTKSLSC